MNLMIETRLADLLRRINADLDRIRDQAAAKLKSMAKSTGQRTRVDRMRK